MEVDIAVGGTGGGLRGEVLGAEWELYEWELAVVLVEAEETREKLPLVLEETDRFDCSDNLDIEGLRPKNSEMDAFRFK